MWESWKTSGQFGQHGYWGGEGGRRRGGLTTKKTRDVFSVCSAPCHFPACAVDGKTTLVTSPPA